MLVWQRQPGTGCLIRQFMFEIPFSTPLASGTALCTQDQVLSVHPGSHLMLCIEQRTPDLPTGGVPGGRERGWGPGCGLV